MGKEKAVEYIVEKVIARFEQFKSRKKELLEVLENMDEFSRILWMMKNRKIITRTDRLKIVNMAELRWISSELHNPDTSSKEKHAIESIDVEMFIRQYPLVVDADEVCEDFTELLGDWLIQIYKSGKAGLVRKTEKNEIEIIFSPKIYTWAFAFSKEEYDKYGLIEIRNYHSDDNTPMGNDSCNTRFLQKEKHTTWLWFTRRKISFIETGNFNVIGDFDKDNIAFALEASWEYCFIYKEIYSDNSVGVHKIGLSFVSEMSHIKEWFDEYNAFETKVSHFGVMIFRKKYDARWDFRWIDAFTKSFLDKEKK